MHVVTRHFAFSGIPDKKMYIYASKSCINDLICVVYTEKYHDGLEKLPWYFSFFTMRCFQKHHGIF